jgi:hypothetical protein
MQNSKQVAERIRRISEWDAVDDFHKLGDLNPNNISPLSRRGLKIVDYFTFHERIRTVGNKGISFMEFLDLYDRVYANKPCIQRQMQYYRETRDYETPEWKKYCIFKMYFGSCNAFKPTVAYQVFHKYKPKTVLDFTAGWGGRLVGACAYGVPSYIGIDTNVNLLVPYGEMTEVLQHMSDTKVEMHFWDAATFDYSRLTYDMVFTSPPYYMIERYPHQPSYTSKRIMSERFYRPAITNTWKHLQPGGVYVINTNKEVYENEFKPILGECDECFTMDMGIKSPDHKYSELLYVWRKRGGCNGCITL